MRWKQLGVAVLMRLKADYVNQSNRSIVDSIQHSNPMDFKEINPVNRHRHPWELSRRDSILNLLDEYVGKGHVLAADIGAGDMFFTREIQKHINGEVYAMDTHYSKDLVVAFPPGIIYLRSIEQLPTCSVDVIFLMDVLEHIDDELTFLKQVTEKLKHNGVLFITVPAFQFLFSSHDEYLGHYRRYRVNDLMRRIREKYNIMECFYFYSTLFFIRLLGKLLFESLLSNIRNKFRPEKGVGQWKYPRNHFWTRFVKNILDIDFRMNRHFCNRGIKLFGLSICMICKKKSV